MIVIFGESPNDTRALRELVMGLCPAAKGRVQTRRKPLSLQRGAGGTVVRSHAAKVAAVVGADRDPVTCVLVHSDADGPDTDGQVERDRTAALLAAGIPCARAVVPVEEIESWWLLFPASVETAFPSWKAALPRSPGDVDSISRPKEQLVRATRSKNPKRPYAEADSHRIAAQIVQDGVEPRGQSASFDRFRAAVSECCGRLTAASASLPERT